MIQRPRLGMTPPRGGWSLSPWFDCLQFRPQVHLPLATGADACCLRFHRWMTRKIGTGGGGGGGGRGGKLGMEVGGRISKGTGQSRAGFQ